MSDYLPSNRDKSKSDGEPGRMNNSSPGNNATDGGEAQNSEAAVPPPESSPSGHPPKNGVQRQQARLRNLDD